MRVMSSGVRAGFWRAGCCFLQPACQKATADKSSYQPCRTERLAPRHYAAGRNSQKNMRATSTGGGPNWLFIRRQIFPHTPCVQRRASCGFCKKRDALHVTPRIAIKYQMLLSFGYGWPVTTAFGRDRPPCLFFVHQKGRRLAAPRPFGERRLEPHVGIIPLFLFGSSLAGRLWAGPVLSGTGPPCRHELRRSCDSKQRACCFFFTPLDSGPVTFLCDRPCAPTSRTPAFFVPP